MMDETAEGEAQAEMKEVGAGLIEGEAVAASEGVVAKAEGEAMLVAEGVGGRSTVVGAVETGTLC